MYGSSSFAQLPYATLPGRLAGALSLSGTASGSSSSSGSTKVVQHKTLIATGSKGNRSIMNLNQGNFIDVIRVSDDRIEATIAQGGRVRTGYIDDPNGIVSYELIATEV